MKISICIKTMEYKLICTNPKYIIDLSNKYPCRLAKKHLRKIWEKPSLSKSNHIKNKLFKPMREYVCTKTH